MKLTTLAGYLAAALLALLLAVSCFTGPVNVPDDATPMELIQWAQEASDRSKYSVSLKYYEALIERFPYDIDNIIAAEYEIAFIHYKQRQYNQSKIEFNNLLNRYNTPDEALLPPQFKILSLKVLSNINEQEKLRQKKQNQ